MADGRAAEILHADLDAFYASVAQRDDPALRGRPVIVGRGVVLAVSYEARTTGVRSGMPGGEARRRCPQAIVVDTDFGAYTEASEAVFAVFRDMTPVVEPISIDEAFLDVSGARRLLGDPTAIAEQLRARVRAEVGLPLSVGIARTKFLAKVASAQSKPDGLLLVNPDRELAFLHPLPVEALWGVGPATRDRLHRRGVRTVGDLAEMPESALVSLLGGAVGRHLRSLAWNHDPRDVTPHRRDHSIGAQRALGRHRRTIDECREIIIGLADRVSSRLRKAERLARTVTLSARFDDMARVTRSRTFVEASDSSVEIAETAVGLATALLQAAVSEEEMPGATDQYASRQAAPTVLERRGVTLLGVRLSGLVDPDAVQLGLPFDRSAHRSELDDRVDEIQRRFGRDALQRTSLLHRDQGIEPPTRPTALDSEAGDQES